MVNYTATYDRGVVMAIGVSGPVGFTLAACWHYALIEALNKETEASGPLSSLKLEDK